MSCIDDGAKQVARKKARQKRSLDQVEGRRLPGTLNLEGAWCTKTPTTHSAHDGAYIISVTPCRPSAANVRSPVRKQRARI
jgi:hypothetical protein